MYSMMGIVQSVRNRKIIKTAFKGLAVAEVSEGSAKAAMLWVLREGCGVTREMGCGVEHAGRGSIILGNYIELIELAGL